MRLHAASDHPSKLHVTFFLYVELSKCQKQRAIAIYQVEKLHLWGVFTPKCEIDGSYAPVQVPRANLFCCADAQSGKLSSCVFGAPLQACYRNANNGTRSLLCYVSIIICKKSVSVNVYA